MAAKKTIKTGDFKEFDTIVDFGEKLKAYWEENARPIIAIGLFICLAAAAAAYWTISNRTSAETAQGLLNEALTTMNGNFPSAAERTAALSALMTLLSRAADDYPRTEAGKSALFYRAQCKYRQQDYSGAIADYTAFLQHSGLMADQLRPFAFENIGYTHEALGDSAEALKWFEKAVQAGRSAALIGMARMQEAAGASEQACEHYKKYLAEQTDTGYRQFAEIKIATLCR